MVLGRFFEGKGAQDDSGEDGEDGRIGTDFRASVMMAGAAKLGRFRRLRRAWRISSHMETNPPLPH